jgi:hypothetical protein
MNSFYSAYIRIYVPSDIIPLVLSLETPVHIQFDTVSSTKVSRVRAEVENYQGIFSSLSLLLAVQAHFDRYREIGEWLWLCPRISHMVETWRFQVFLILVALNEVGPFMAAIAHKYEVMC